MSYPEKTWLLNHIKTGENSLHNTDRSKALLLLWIIYGIYVLCLSCIAALWSTEGKGLTYWLLLFVAFNVILILLLSHLVSCDRCGTWLFRFLILAVFLTLLKANTKGADQPAQKRSLVSTFVNRFLKRILTGHNSTCSMENSIFYNSL